MTKKQGILKVALLQLCATEDKSANIKQAIAMSTEAFSKGAKFVALPEVFNFRSDGKNKELYVQAAENTPGLTTHLFMALARKYKATILLGSILEKAKGSRVYNTSVLINPSGQITAQYRKIHLFDACLENQTIKEADIFLCGRRSIRTKIGEFKAGLSICYDLRFGDLYQGYSNQGVDILTVPSCFTQKTGKAHWEVLLRARAIENLCYVLAPNQVGGPTKNLQAYGHSLIVSPWGEIIAQGSARGQEIIFGNINCKEIKKARSFLPGIVR